LRIDHYGLEVGNPANIIVLDAKDLREAYSYHSEPKHVIRDGVPTGP
jgi:cytosine/adenosine deaminase-related metal-dependent hydrolase